MSSDEDAIRALSDEFVAACNESDVDRWMNLFTDDTIWMVPDIPILIGKQALRDWVKPAFFDAFDMTLDNSIVDLEIAGDWAYGRLTDDFTGTLKDSGDTITANGKMVGIFRKQSDDTWKWHLFIFNWDAPFGS